MITFGSISRSSGTTSSSAPIKRTFLPQVLRYYNRLYNDKNTTTDRDLAELLKESKKEAPKFLEQLAGARDHQGNTLLHLAAEFQSPAAFRLIHHLVKDVGVPVDALDFKTQRTALMRAVMKKRLQVGPKHCKNRKGVDADGHEKTAAGRTQTLRLIQKPQSPY